MYLVGAGPGDAGLLTLRAKRLLGQADAVVYDRLLTPRLLNFVPDRASAYYVGKEANHHSLPQNEIESLLIRLAQEGKRVVRLKGGDPFVYGRGGEEAMALKSAGIAFEVVPGVTSAISVPAYAGIPVTHRRVATSVTVMTGHEITNQGLPTAGQVASYPDKGTLVILMGVAQLPHLVQQQLAAGRLPSTPVAMVRSGTLAAQATVVATLETIVEVATAAEFASPAIIIVGDVVSLREEIQWAESRPLFGKRILICAETSATASHFADEVEDLGGEAFDISIALFKQHVTNFPSVVPGFQALERSWDLSHVDAVWIIPSSDTEDSNFDSTKATTHSNNPEIVSCEWQTLFTQWIESMDLPRKVKEAVAENFRTVITSASIDHLISRLHSRFISG